MEDNKAAPSAPPQGGGASRRPLGVLLSSILVRISYVFAHAQNLQHIESQFDAWGCFGCLQNFKMCKLHGVASPSGKTKEGGQSQKKEGGKASGWAPEIMPKHGKHYF